MVLDNQLGPVYRQLLSPDRMQIFDWDPEFYMDEPNEQLSFMQMQARVREDNALLVGFIHLETRKLYLNPAQKQAGCGLLLF